MLLPTGKSPHLHKDSRSLIFSSIRSSFEKIDVECRRRSRSSLLIKTFPPFRTTNRQVLTHLSLSSCLVSSIRRTQLRFNIVRRRDNGSAFFHVIITHGLGCRPSITLRRNHPNAIGDHRFERRRHFFEFSLRAHHAQRAMPFVSFIRLVLLVLPSPPKLIEQSSIVDLRHVSTDFQRPRHLLATKSSSISPTSAPPSTSLLRTSSSTSECIPKS